MSSSLAALEFQPLGLDLQALQPVFVLDGAVYVKARGTTPAVPGPRAAALVTALGVEHPLRRLASRRDLAERSRRLVGAHILHRARAVLAQRTATAGTDALLYFLDHLVPACQTRDWGDTAPLVPRPPPALDAAALPAAGGEVLVPVPAFPLPSPCLWVLGRVWLLAETPPLPARPPRVHVVYRGAALVVTGDYVAAATLEREHRAQVEQAVLAAAASLEAQAAQATAAMEPEVVRLARAELAATGCVQRGDLLLIAGGAGEPPHLGHLIDPAHRRHLAPGRRTRPDLAMTLPLTLPPQIATLGVHRRDASGCWLPFRPPQGLCLGISPPLEQEHPDPGVRAAAWLRQAAVQVATNGGKFHEHEEND